MGLARLKYKLAGKSIHSQSLEVSDCLCIGPWHGSERLVTEARTAFPTEHC